MRGYVAFLKKEWMEAIRNYRLFIMLAVFLLLGIMNPLTAKLMPDILENFMPSGMTIEITEPTAMDSWMKFFKYFPQMGLAVVIIVFSGMMAHEWSKETLIPLLTKGLRRSSVLLAKLTMASVIWTISYALCASVSWGYTAYFWSSEGVHHVITSIACLWLFGLMLLCLIAVASVLTKTMGGTLLIVAGAVGTMFLLNMLPKLQEYNPIRLASTNMQLIQGTLTPEDCTKAIIVTLIICVVSIFAGIEVFNRRRV